MTLVGARDAGFRQPALAVALSPWTDTGFRGVSQFGNDVYDMVQGYMTIQFSKWLKGDQPLSDQEVSPIYQSLHGLAPIYLQAGGKAVEHFREAGVVTDLGYGQPGVTEHFRRTAGRKEFDALGSQALCEFEYTRLVGDGNQRLLDGHGDLQKLMFGEFLAQGIAVDAQRLFGARIGGFNHFTVIEVFLVANCAVLDRR
mgnify:CR=1 FL=1